MASIARQLGSLLRLANGNGNAAAATGRCLALKRLCSSSSQGAVKPLARSDQTVEAEQQQQPKAAAAATTTAKRTVATNVEGLKAFFDDPKNFGAEEVKHGRGWTLDELRIKSNSDLHKLWFVLLKEHNMLLTLEAAAAAECEAMPSPERLDKVQDSMKNLETVVRERNKAYFDLEVGECGERPHALKLNWMGLRTRAPLAEHFLPQRYNTSYNRKYPLPFNDKNQSWFLNRYREQRLRVKSRLQRREKRAVLRQLSRYQDVDVDELRERYPSVDVDSLASRVKEKLSF